MNNAHETALNRGAAPRSYHQNRLAWRSNVLYAGGITKGTLFMKGNKQAGFSIVEAVIVVAVVGIIGVAGWLVYQHDRTKVTDAAAGGAPSTSQQTTTTTPGQIVGTLDIKEWGVHMSLNSTTASLYYYIGPQTSDVAYLSLRTVSTVAPDCAADKTSLAAISRLTEAQQQAIVSGSTPGLAGTIHIGSY